MKRNRVILLIVFFLGFSCENVSPDDNFIIGQEISFHFGNEYYSNDNKIKLTVTEINDSRCPEGAYCFWAGMVQVEILLNLMEETKSFTLNTLNNPSDTIGNYVVSLINVTPYPKLNETIPKEKYNVILSISEVEN